MNTMAGHLTGRWQRRNRTLHAGYTPDRTMKNTMTVPQTFRYLDQCACLCTCSRLSHASLMGQDQ